MFPGLSLSPCTPASRAARASRYWKWMSAMIGTGDRGTISARPPAASASLQVMRTMSAPAPRSAYTWDRVASTSAVFVVVIDCTLIGAPPPIATAPTLRALVGRRSLTAG